jgi:hypothetical protein
MGLDQTVRVGVQCVWHDSETPELCKVLISSCRLSPLWVLKPGVELPLRLRGL